METLLYIVQFKKAIGTSLFKFRNTFEKKNISWSAECHNKQFDNQKTGLNVGEN